MAINKVDKPSANPDRIKQELTEQGLVAEDWGGETIMVPVSALRGENLDNLLEMILLVAEVEELVANPDRLAKGTVIEANLDRTKGPVATLLVQNGTLRVGDSIVAGSVFGKIRAMIDDRGQKVEAATPSFAVEILGLSDVPAVAMNSMSMKVKKRPDQLPINGRSNDATPVYNRPSPPVALALAPSLSKLKKDNSRNLISSSRQMCKVPSRPSSVRSNSYPKTKCRFGFSSPLREITETDVDLAAASGAVVVGFNTTLASGAQRMPPIGKGSIFAITISSTSFSMIFKGRWKVFSTPKKWKNTSVLPKCAVFTVGRGAVAGCYVQSGKLVRNRFLRVRRGKEIVYQGVLDSLKRMKEDAREVATGFECGVGVSKFNDWKEGDIIEAYEMVMKRRTLSS
ncbi:MAG UNVERIFIED_CONTAM: hypothetical protein LVR29_11225 [Microcystis novacekii LVE1205-3]